MPNITLLISPSCGACPSAKSLWKQLRVKYSFSYREVDITTPDGQELANRHSVRAVPATIIDGRLTFVGVPSRESAENALQLKMRPKEGEDGMIDEDDIELPIRPRIHKSPPPGCPICRDPMSFIDGDWACFDCNGELLGPET